MTIDDRGVFIRPGALLPMIKIKEPSRFVSLKYHKITFDFSFDIVLSIQIILALFTPARGSVITGYSPAYFQGGG